MEWLYGYIDKLLLCGMNGYMAILINCCCRSGRSKGCSNRGIYLLREKVTQQYNNASI